MAWADIKDKSGRTVGSVQYDSAADKAAREAKVADRKADWAMAGLQHYRDEINNRLRISNIVNHLMTAQQKAEYEQKKKKAETQKKVWESIQHFAVVLFSLNLIIILLLILPFIMCLFTDYRSSTVTTTLYLGASLLILTLARWLLRLKIESIEAYIDQLADSIYYGKKYVGNKSATKSFSISRLPVFIPTLVLYFGGGAIDRLFSPDFWASVDIIIPPIVGVISHYLGIGLSLFAPIWLVFSLIFNLVAKIRGR